MRQKPEDNINEEEPLISNEEERERASKLSIGISNCKTNDNTINEKNGDFMKLKKLSLDTILLRSTVLKKFIHQKQI